MSVMERIEALCPEISSRAQEIEAARRLPGDLAAKLADTGAFRLMIPESLGGFQAEPSEIIRVVERVGREDASTAWCVMIAGTNSVVSAYLPQEVAEPIFGDPKVITGGVFAPKGQATLEDGSYRINGHWNWASGSTHCHWLTGGCVVMEDGRPRLMENGAPEIRSMVFPADEVELKDTWQVLGQCGTGSGDMIARDLIVPQERSVSLATDKPVAEGALYAFPVFGILALGICSVSLGNARGAIDDLIDLATEKTPQGSTKTLANRAYTQIEIAKAEAGLSSARAFVMEAVDDAWQAAQKEGEISLDLRARLRLAATHATRTASDVVRAMYDLGGGSSVFLASPLQRRLRDAHVATSHMMIAPPTYELAGRVFLGLDTDSTFL